MRSCVGPFRGRVPAVGVALALAAGGAGCSNSPRLYPVTGKVVFADGTPFKGGSVCFDPVDPNLSPASAEGGIKADGTFTLRSNGVGDGAYPGRYQAAILLPDRGDYDPNRPPEPPILRKFTSTRTSGLEFTVEPDKPNDFTITVTRNPAAKK